MRFDHEEKYSAPAIKSNGQFMKTLRQLSLSFMWLAAACLPLSAMAQTPPPGTITYIHNDLLGSPAAATNAAGAVVWREAYSGYGERLKNEAGATANKVWYTSRHQDEDTGLVYMGARYYDPALGRFLSMDSVGFNEQNSHSFNRYAYANNNPYKYSDPDGRMAHLVARATYGVSYQAATYLGAAVLGGFLAQGAGDFRDYILSNSAGDGGVSRPKPPQNVEPITNAPQEPNIPEGWEQRPGREPGSTIHYPPGTDPAKGENIRVMPPGSYPVDGYENGYWVHTNGGRQRVDPSTGKPGKGRGDTHVPRPAPVQEE